MSGVSNEDEIWRRAGVSVDDVEWIEWALLWEIYHKFLY